MKRWSLAALCGALLAAAGCSTIERAQPLPPAAAPTPTSPPPWRRRWASR